MLLLVQDAAKFSQEFYMEKILGYARGGGGYSYEIKLSPFSILITLVSNHSFCEEQQPECQGYMIIVEGVMRIWVESGHKAYLT